MDNRQIPGETEVINLKISNMKKLAYLFVMVAGLTMAAVNLNAQDAKTTPAKKETTTGCCKSGTKTADGKCCKKGTTAACTKKDATSAKDKKGTCCKAKTGATACAAKSTDTAK
jgi:hypothetical protein